MLLKEDILPDVDFIPFNPAIGYGFLRVMSLEERPSPRDIVIYETLPNELSLVAGIITAVPQTPLSHVNLRAVQDGVPNAFIRDALDDDGIDDLIGRYVRYRVTDTGWEVRAASRAEVDAHFATSRPAVEQTPKRNLAVTEIRTLSQIGFDDWTAFGVKAANLAVLRTFGFPSGTIPDGFAIPFYFYDEFMKHNGFNDDIQEMLADTEFQTDYEVQKSRLKKLRKAIKKGETPQWIIDALTEMHDSYPAGQSLRYRSSTNNEDLPRFSGAGLYDSKTQKPDETEEDGIDKSLKQVYASLWNFRAFIERDFQRVDHMAAAMGVLVHPNYSDEKVNGVAVSFDPIGGTDGNYYVNAQLGEDLVTNPEAYSVPEELLLQQEGTYEVLATSNQVPRGELLMTDAQMGELRRHLTAVHDRFRTLYNPDSGEEFAMEVEFKITSNDVLAIKQARPWIFEIASDETEATVAESLSKDATLSGLTLSGIDIGTFESVTTRYTANAANDVATTTVTPTVNDAGATNAVKLGGVEDADEVVSLTVGTNVITVEVTSADGNTIRAYTITVNRAADNTPGTGEPTVSGRAQAGETLTADTSGIADADGLSNVTYSYQWIADDTDITGATAAAYTLADGDVGKAIKVRVSFTDDAGAEETLTSAATAAVVAANRAATGAPTISGRAQAGETLTAGTSDIADADGLSNVTYSYHWIADDTDITGAAAAAYTLTTGEVERAIKVRVSFTDEAGNKETLTSVATTAVAPARPNRAATGAPAISETAQAGERLTADTTGIADADGLSNVTYSYQWIADDTDITGATASTYTLTNGDVGKAIKVWVSFTDEGGNSETLTSAATAEVAARPSVWSVEMSAFDWGNGHLGGNSPERFSNEAGSLHVQWLWYSEPHRRLYLAFSEAVTDADQMTLQIDNVSLDFPEGSSNNSAFTFEDVDLSWTGGQTIRASLIRQDPP